MERLTHCHDGWMQNQRSDVGRRGQGGTEMARSGSRKQRGKSDLNPPEKAGISRGLPATAKLLGCFPVLISQRSSSPSVSHVSQDPLTTDPAPVGNDHLASEK